MSLDSSKGYAWNFWSAKEDASANILIDHFHEGLGTMEKFLQFYKERCAIETEYARKLENLARKSPLNSITCEASSLSNSISTLVTETGQLSSGHKTEGQKISDSVYQPLKEFYSQLKAKAKPLENAIMEFCKYKNSYYHAVKELEAKYEAQWKKINSYKTEQILLDDTESAHLQRKIDKCANSMIHQRAKYYKLVQKYNRIQDSFKKQWCKYCENAEACEAERIKYLRKNAWEYANAVSSSCICDDQSAENIRLSLEKCSYVKDIEEFVQLNGTGNMTPAHIKFIDFAKGERRSHSAVPVAESVDVDELLQSTESRSTVSSAHTATSAKRLTPPKGTERQQTMIDFIDRSSKTFSELQEPQKHKSDTRNVEEADSEPGSYKIMSDCSRTTGSTSVGSSASYNKSKLDTANLKASLISNPLLNSLSSSGISAASISHKMKNIDSNDMLKNSSDPLKAYLSDLSLGGNGDMSKLRKSMQSTNGRSKDVSEASSRREIVHKLLETDDRDVPAPKAKANRLPAKKARPWSMQPMGKQPTKSRISSASSVSGLHRGRSSLRRAKSQQSIHNKFVTCDDLPSHSSEGFPVIKYCRAQFSYKPEIEQELGFNKRDILMILHQQPDGWWFAENVNTGDSGLAPSNYLADL